MSNGDDYTYLTPANTKINTMETISYYYTITNYNGINLYFGKYLVTGKYIYSDKYRMMYFLDGKLHRSNGPALIYYTGLKSISYFYLGTEYKKKEEWFQVLTTEEKRQALWNSFGNSNGD